MTESTGRRGPVWAMTLAAAVVYGLALAKLLFWREPMTMYGAAWSDAWTNWDYPLANLTPLRTIESYLFHRDRYNFDIWFRVFFGNLFLFLPFGVLTAVLAPRYRKLLPYATLLLAVIVAVELVQKATMTGAFDVDDIILNFIGGMLGMLVARAIGLKPAGKGRRRH